MPFIFQIKKDFIDYCDPNQYWTTEYMVFTIIYVGLIMVIPILVIFVSNSCILYKTYKSDSLRDSFIQNQYCRTRRRPILRLDGKINLNKISNKSCKYKLKPYYLNINQLVKQISHNANNSKKLTKILTMFSFAYAIFNLPYFITWSIFYYYYYYNFKEEAYQNYLIAFVKIAELFYILNFGINFYIYFFSGSTFRKQVKYSSKFSRFLKFVLN